MGCWDNIKEFLIFISKMLVINKFFLFFFNILSDLLCVLIDKKCVFMV